MKTSSRAVVVVAVVFLALLVLGTLIITEADNEQKHALGKATESLDEIDQARESGALTADEDYWRQEDERIAQEALYQRARNKEENE
ncbi:MAG: hypothetical protein GXP30_00260 [Verrucomicrobia bacterium]|nr:hypothetical protein [Verrucomicrobiota bacterium]